MSTQIAEELAKELLTIYGLQGALEAIREHKRSGKLPPFPPAGKKCQEETAV